VCAAKVGLKAVSEGAVQTAANDDRAVRKRLPTTATNEPPNSHKGP